MFKQPLCKEEVLRYIEEIKTETVRYIEMFSGALTTSPCKSVD
jgi:hypothetical protein